MPAEEVDDVTEKHEANGIRMLEREASAYRSNESNWPLGCRLVVLAIDLDRAHSEQAPDIHQDRGNSSSAQRCLVPGRYGVAGVCEFRHQVGCHGRVLKPSMSPSRNGKLGACHRSFRYLVFDPGQESAFTGAEGNAHPEHR